MQLLFRLRKQVRASLRKFHVGGRSCFHSRPRSIASFRPAPYSAGLPPCSNRNGPLIFSMWIRPSWTGSTVLAISRSFRIAVSGSDNGLGSTNLFMCHCFRVVGKLSLDDRRPVRHLRALCFTADKRHG